MGNKSAENIIILDAERVAKIIADLKRGGAHRLQVVSDFDRTLTTCFNSQGEIVSLISILMDEHYLTPDYPEKARALFHKYHPAEIDPGVPLKEKRKLMHEWWQVHYDLLIASGLNREDIRKAAQSERISPRPGVLELFDFLRARGIPMTIFSSSGLGGENIAFYLERLNKLSVNVNIVANAFIWDEAGRAVDVREPIIHTFNKNFATVKTLPFYDKIKDRRNVILLGDGLGDAAMLGDFAADQVLKIGFLNENVANNLTAFKKIYDVVILNDGSMDYVNELLAKIVIF